MDVSDVRSNEGDQIVYAAKKVGTSLTRQKVFSAICAGKKKKKAISEIVQITGLPRKRVLEEAIKLHNNHVLKQVQKGNDPVYEKDSFYCQHSKKILSLANSKSKRDKVPTKTNPRGTSQRSITVKFNASSVNIKQITIDDVSSFSKARKKKESTVKQIYENEVKQVLKTAIGEDGKFIDWGGETDDLYSTRLKLNGKRIGVAFGLKGRGTKGILTPKKMGKNGDQIQRLFKSPAEVFFVQHVEQIDESVIDQMKTHAIAKSVTEGKRIYYGIIDGKDTSRLISAYKK